MTPKKFNTAFFSFSGVIIVGMLFQWLFVSPNTQRNTSIQMQQNQRPKFLEVSDQWADSIMKRMNREQKIAQFFMVAAYSDKKNNEKELNTWIDQHGIGVG